MIYLFDQCIFILNVWAEDLAEHERVLARILGTHTHLTPHMHYFLTLTFAFKGSVSAGGRGAENAKDEKRFEPKAIHSE